MPKETKHACEICKKPTELKGWVFRQVGKKFSLKNMKKEYKWWCKEHFLSYMFNLYPFACTKSCAKSVGKKLGYHLREDDTYVWCDVVVSFVPAVNRKNIKDGQSIPLKASTPKCPHCSKAMKMVKNTALE